jgi:hypothetical protein
MAQDIRRRRQAERHKYITLSDLADLAEENGRIYDTKLHNTQA